MENDNVDDSIPQQAYLYFPQGIEIKTAEGLRRIFNNVIFDELEKQKISMFEAYCQKQKYELSSIWTAPMILRFLQANGFKNEKTLTAVKAHTQWRAQSIPTKITSNIKNFLNMGLLYIHGRDHRFRPIVVLNAYKIDIKKVELNEMIESITFILDYILKNLFLPGQVENWIFIMDLNKMGLASLPLGPIKNLLSFLQHNYRGHLYALYMVNTPSSIYIPWKIVKSFLDETTVKKISFYNNNNPLLLWNHTNKDQIEAKFNGSAENCEIYWPPCFPSNNYLLTNDDEKCLFISKEEYNKRYENQDLKGYKICKGLLNNQTESTKITESSIIEPNQNLEPIKLEKKEDKQMMMISQHENDADYFLSMEEEPTIKVPKPETIRQKSFLN